MTTTADLLDEYGQALRGAWGGIDGRSEKRALLELSDAIREHGNDALPHEEVTRLRDELGLCPTGGSHWIDWDDSCEVYGCADRKGTQK